jgi:trans-aconitate 2-methyltransferase
MDMPIWNPEQYLQFDEERSRPCRDLVARIDLPAPRSVIDLGCGPGNSTAVLAARWPDAAITGLDSSPEMIAAARERSPERQWIRGEIGHWARVPGPGFDLVFSNAALQWVREQDAVFPGLLRRVRPGGALAVQMPSKWDSPAHRIMRELAASPVWAHRMARAHEADWRTETAGYYYDVLAPLASRIDLWETEYLHVMDTVQDIVEWYRGTGLRPFLEALASEAERSAFIEEFTDRIRPHYLPRKNSKVLFPFRRMFLVAYVSGPPGSA